MLQLSPQSIRIIKSFDDGKNAKHFTFQAISFTPSPVIIGQFFMLHVPGVGAAPFTYASLPDNQGRFNALIRKVGEVTEAIFSLNIGAVLGYTGSLGVGWPLDQLKNKEVLIVAGGCGLATIAALINYLIEKGQANTTTLIYGASTTEAQVLNVERANWKSALLVHDTLLDSPNTEQAGTPSAHISRILATHNRKPDIVLTCGPEVMMQSVADTCLALDIAPHQIWLSLERRMHCGVGLCGHCYLADNLVCTQGPNYRFDKYIALKQKTTSFSKHNELITYC